MRSIFFGLLFVAPTMTFAKASVLVAASSTYVHVESYNDADLTDMGIDLLTDDALEAELKSSSVCGPNKYSDVMGYAPADFVEDIGYLYSQPAAKLLTRLQEKNMLPASDFNTLAFELNQTTNALMSYLEGKVLNVCAEYSTSAYTGGQTTYYVMVDGVVEFAIFVGRP